jgi:hypothetical protein
MAAPPLEPGGLEVDLTSIRPPGAQQEHDTPR